MNQNIQEYVDSRGVDLRVDRQTGVVRGVKILGLESRNRRSYAPDALSRAIDLYEGAKVNVNHPKGDPLAPRDYQDRIGVIRNIALRDGQGLFGDFHFNPKHALAEQLVWDAQHATENVGFSHNVQARVAKKSDSAIVEEILQVQSVDLVADPATTRGLFEQHDSSQLAAEYQTRLEELRRQLDEYRAREAIESRRAEIGGLLAEYRLPDPASGDRAAKTVVSEEFLARLMAAESEDQLRELVRDRAKLVRDLGGSLAGRPISRDQTLVDRREEPVPIADAKSFARAIT